jgi:hypothetical protein
MMPTRVLRGTTRASSEEMPVDVMKQALAAEFAAQ